jgi:putative membrane protein
MLILRSAIFTAALFVISSTVAQTTALSDSRIAHLAETASEIDTAMANMALNKASNEEIKSFAQQINRDQVVGKADALSSFHQLGLKLEDNELSKSLSEVGAERSKELAGLSGPAYDKAYLENEIAYNVFVIGVLEVTALPSIKNPGLKRLLEARLEIIKDHKKNAEALLKKLR